MGSLPEKNRVRARIKEPDGWFSLENMENGYRWANRKDALQPTKDTPGLFVIEYDGTVVKASVSVDSSEVAKLAKGTVVEVLEVTPVPDKKRLRARIKEPVGWFSLENTETGYRWANRKDMPAPAAPAPRATPKPVAATPPPTKKNPVKEITDTP